MKKNVLMVLSLIVTQCIQCEIDKKDLRRYLPENPTIIDAGAHNGRGTVELAEAFPGATIYAFEPVPELYNELVHRTRSLPNVRTFSYALSDETGIAKMHVSHGLGDGSSSLLEPKDHLTHFPAVSFPRTISVNTITLDDWAEKYNIPSVDFFWFDLQGAEYKVLKASPKMLSQVKAIYAEFSLVELYEGLLLYDAFKGWVEGLGFDEVYKILIHETFGDVLFVRSE